MIIPGQAATEDPRLMPISMLAERYSAGLLDATDVINACFASIASNDGVLNTFCNRFERQARQQAAETARRFHEQHPLGLLDGMPVALKDVFDVAGSVTSGNSFAFTDRVAAADCDVVRDLRSAGAILLGKNTLYELCSGDPDDGPALAARNPWDLAIATGGSSSGSAAAIAAGFATAALGTDTGGSVRIPAAHCGVAGFKPTYGAISMLGVLPLAWSLDHVGIMARSAGDIVPVFATLAKRNADTVPPINCALTGRRFGAPLEFVYGTPGIDAEVIRAYERALEALRAHGARVDRVTLPYVEHVQVVADIIARSEAFTYHKSRLRSAAHRYGRGILTYLAKGAAYGADDYILARRGRTLVTDAFARLMDDHDFIVLPTVHSPAGPAHSRLPDSHKTQFTRPFNITSQPAISIIMGVSSQGRPLGLQIAGRTGDDFAVLAAAQAFELFTRANGMDLTLATALRYKG